MTDRWLTFSASIFAPFQTINRTPMLSKDAAANSVLRQKLKCRTWRSMSIQPKRRTELLFNHWKDEKQKIDEGEEGFSQRRKEPRQVAEIFMRTCPKTDFSVIHFGLLRLE